MHAYIQKLIRNIWQKIRTKTMQHRIVSFLMIFVLLVLNFDGIHGIKAKEIVEDEDCCEVIAVMEDEELLKMADGETSNIYQGQAITYGNYSTHFYATSENPDASNCDVYCVDPSRTGPNGQTYQAQVVSNDNIRKYMYYSYGAPGWTIQQMEVHYQNAFFAGKEVEASKYYAYSHFLLSAICASEGVYGGDGWEAGVVGYIAGLEAVMNVLSTLPSPPNSFQVYSLSCDDTYQRMLTWDWIWYGKASLNKKNTVENDSPQGAIFHVYYYATPQQRANALATHTQTDYGYDRGAFSIDANGNGYVNGVVSNFVLDNLEKGYYLIVETTPPWSSSYYNTYGWIEDGDNWQGPYAFDVTDDNINTMFTFELEDEYQDEEEEFTHISIKKESDEDDITNDNSIYSLKGASYAIYESWEDANNFRNEIDRITTDEKGEGVSGDLTEGTYYLREVQAPDYFKMDENIYEVTTSEEESEVQLIVKESPDYDDFKLLVWKKSMEELPLKGAKFMVKYYDNMEGNTDGNPKRTWYFESDQDGKCLYGEAWLVSDKKSDLLYTLKDGSNYLPCGTITVEEYEAPEGYTINNTAFSYICSNHAEKSDTEREKERIMHDQKICQSFAIIKYGETADKKKKPLANAGFSACPVSELSMDENGEYIWDSEKEIEIAMDGGKIMYTDGNGYALSKELEFGTYLVRETVVPEGYLAVKDFEVTISRDSREPQEIRYFTDELFKAYLKIVKLDGETMKPILNNAASFKIWSYELNTYLKLGENDSEIITTNSEGELLTKEPLPYGEYRVDEVSCPDGYCESMLRSVDFSITKNQMYETYIDEDGNKNVNMGVYTIHICNNQQYGKIEVNKEGEYIEFDEDTSSFVKKTRVLEGIHFDIYAGEDIYSQDGNGDLIYETDELIETIVTNEEGYACSITDLPLGVYYLHETVPDIYLKTEDIIIDIKKDGKIKTENGKNESKEELTREIYYVTVDVLNYWKDQKIVGTNAKNTETNSKVAMAKDNAKIADEILYENLIPGGEYQVKTVLMNADTKLPLLNTKNEVVEKMVGFIPENETGSFVSEIEFDATNLKGQTVVVFEYLYYEGKLISMHADFQNESQKIWFPEIMTTAKDFDSNANDGKRNEKSVIIDTVEYHNLYADENTKYVMRGVIMDAGTNSMYLENGNTVEATLSFYPYGQNISIATETEATDLIATETEAAKTTSYKTASGNVSLAYTLNSMELKGKSVVVFEKLYYVTETGEEVLVAVHEDITDKGQTITYDDEIASLVLGAKQTKKPGQNIVYTGDKSKIAVAFIMLSLSLLAGIYFVKKRKEGRNEK